jgi:hypothetical protein
MKMGCPPRDRSTVGGIGRMSKATRGNAPTNRSGTAHAAPSPRRAGRPASAHHGRGARTGTRRSSRHRHDRSGGTRGTRNRRRGRRPWRARSSGSSAARMRAAPGTQRGTARPFGELVACVNLPRTSAAVSKKKSTNAPLLAVTVAAILMVSPPSDPEDSQEGCRRSSGCMAPTSATSARLTRGSPTCGQNEYSPRVSPQSSDPHPYRTSARARRS